MTWGWNGKETYTSWVKDGDGDLDFQYHTGPRVTLLQGMFNMTPALGEPVSRTTRIKPGAYRLTQVQECFHGGCRIIKGDLASFVVFKGQKLSFPAVGIVDFDAARKKLIVSVQAGGNAEYSFGRDVEVK
jgi:hypothetical protein